MTEDALVPITQAMEAAGLRELWYSRRAGTLAQITVIDPRTLPGGLALIGEPPSMDDITPIRTVLAVWRRRDRGSQWQCVNPREPEEPEI
jgi:hypothetical protein